MMDKLICESVHGLLTQQSCNIYDSLNSLYITLAKENNFPKTIVEIGTRRGGFSIILAKHSISIAAEIYTYDINNFLYRKKTLRKKQETLFSDYNINFYLADVLTDAKQEVIDFIQRDGLTLLFCDGGNKKLEINTFAEYMKSGDIILGHDYAFDKEYYKKYIKDKYWNCNELKYEQVSEKLNENDFQPFLQKEFEKSAWLIERKK